MLAQRPLDLGALVTDVMRTWRTSGRLDRHDVELRISPVWIVADGTRIEQILTNLVGNARKYTQPGGRVTVTVAPEGQTAVLDVADTGIGIPPTLVDHVFDLFVQGDRGLDRSQDGLGLGLSLVKTLVEKHGGTVTVSSPGPGQGARFTVRFPRVEPAPRPCATPIVPAAAARPCRILLIEDNADAREMLSVTLRLDGHEVDAA